MGFAEEPLLGCQTPAKLRTPARDVGCEATEIVPWNMGSDILVVGEYQVSGFSCGLVNAYDAV